MDLVSPDRFEPDELGMDELVLTNVDMVHLERMESGVMWLGVYRGNETFRIWLRCNGKLRVSVEQEHSSASGESK